jgi:hypothetical protein
MRFGLGLIEYGPMERFSASYRADWAVQGASSRTFIRGVR